MKRIIKLFFLILSICVLIIGWLLFSSTTKFNGKLKHIYIVPGSSQYNKQILTQLDSAKITGNLALFKLLSGPLKIYDKITPGRFTIKKGDNLFTILQILKENRQDSVRFTIKRVRTIKGFSAMLGANFITDSANSYAFLSNNDSLKRFGVDTNTLLTLLIPGTYTMKWQYSIPQILNIFVKAKEDFWNANQRLEKANILGLSPDQVVTLGSIVEEETFKDSEKDTIASVYLNRLHQNIALGADPTIKFALKDFDMQRIMEKDLKVVSPYNTYINKGLPPGPICTPDAITIDAVLNAPKTDYLFFVAKASLNGYHDFSSDYQRHLELAKQYHDTLNKRNIK